MSSIAAIDLDYDKVILDDGTELPVTNWFDDDGDECDPDDAITCIAGTDEDGWLTIDLRQFGEATYH